MTYVENAPGAGPGGLLADSLPPHERANVKDELFTRWIHRNTITPHPGNAIASEHDDFFNAIRTGSEPTVNASAGCYALEIATRITNLIKLAPAAEQPSVEIHPLRNSTRRAA
jgi:hypothetical protein